MNNNRVTIRIAMYRDSCFLQIEVFSLENGNIFPVTQIAVDRPNYTWGRDRSLPALYINNPSPNLSAEKPCLSPGLQKIVRLSAEMSSDDRVNSTDSPVLSSASGGNLATDKPRPSRMRARRCSLSAIAYKPGNSATASHPVSHNFCWLMLNCLHNP